MMAKKKYKNDRGRMDPNCPNGSKLSHSFFYLFYFFIFLSRKNRNGRPSQEKYKSDRDRMDPNCCIVFYFIFLSSRKNRNDG